MKGTALYALRALNRLFQECLLECLVFPFAGKQGQKLQYGPCKAVARDGIALFLTNS
jgi:hypothetical protein